MKAFLDSSAFAKRYIEEAGSQSIDEICLEATELCLSVICIPELISALNRRVRESSLSQKNYRVIKKALLEDVRDITIINLTPEVISATTRLLEDNTLRAMDALHVACALECEADLFVSSDKQQMIAARNAGLMTRLV
ncbi:type II toxin-antitoxin system VapC family toxin [Desulfatirhabdium butyrativorans]|uniref:type II toxin-antitoxin system VapC family toxin n=1 Tax=Desulfatirhabdium butyrativorans TaxID=340467 RepID=UPI00048A31ED|nr:type II toxin-antitoxin system VapC family toxin [Desulfatirhabdium butyrativorans]